MGYRPYCVRSLGNGRTSGSAASLAHSHIEPMRVLTPLPKQKSSSDAEAFLLVPGAGIEPAHGCPYRCLRPTRLPIPPSRHETCYTRATDL